MDQHLQRAEFLARLLDDQFEVFGIRFGLGGIIGLFPEIGDIVDAVMSMYLVWIGWQMQLPGVRIAQMVGNIGINFLIGAIPVIGDATYIFRRANMRNLAILKRYAYHEGQIVASRTA